MAIVHKDGERKPRLTGSRCRCAVCGKHFNSVSAFDRHRYGDYGNFGRSRRCRTWQELRERGWVVNSAGFWIERQRIDAPRMRNDLAQPVGQEGSL